jgi:putative protease
MNKSDQKAARVRKKPELLAPAGSLEKCAIAFLYGADAVYVGGKNYNLRAHSRNLNREELAAACYLAHRLGKKIYVTANIFARESDLDSLPAFLRYLQDIAVDGIILSDPGVMLLAKQWAPTIPIHLSTQCNTTNSLSALFWQQQGVHRINLAREISFDELSAIRNASSSALEVFIHGALCMAYSGRCLLSAVLNRRSSNRGLCTQPCRWSYQLLEEKRPGEYFPIVQDFRGSYILNSRDLCLMAHLGELMALGIDAFKVEGRMKGALYLASVLRSYRQAIDRHWEHPGQFQVEEHWQDDLQRVSHRPYTSGLLFCDGEPTQELSTSAPYIRSHTLAGLVRALPVEIQGQMEIDHSVAGHWTVMESRSQLRPGMELEFLHPDGSGSTHMLTQFFDLQGKPLPVAHPNTWIQFSTPFKTCPLQVIRTAAGP